jgi:hypothetical protein
MMQYGDLVMIVARPGTNIISRDSKLVVVGIYLGMDEPWGLFHRFLYNGTITTFDEVFWVFKII